MAAAPETLRRAAPPERTAGHARPGSLGDALVVVGLGGLLVAGTEIAFVLHRGGPYAWLTALFPVVGLLYIGVGLLAWRRRPSSRLGLLIVLAGGAILVASLTNIDTPATRAAGAVFQTVVFAVIVQLLLAFPTGRLRERVERRVVLAVYAVSLLLQPPAYLFAPDGPLSIADRPDLVDAGLQVQRAAGAVAVLATSVLLVRRMRRARLEQRRVLVPLSAYGIFTVLFIPVSSALNDTVFGGSIFWLGVSQLAVVALVPIVFVVAASRGGFERTGDIAELGAWLGADEVARLGLREALAATLGDPSVQLLFRVPGEDALVDERGTPAVVPAQPGRGVVDVALGGRAVGAIAYDASLLDRPEDVREAGRVVALALDRQRLTVELRASRTRIAAAADDERRRIARDLHDGLQSRLVFLAVQAGTTGDARALQGGIEAAIDELRGLVEGVMPASLTERGLPAALEDLRDHLTIPIALQVTGLGRRMRPDVETTAYFVVSEAVVNAVKHAGPATVAVSLERTDDRLHLEVADDGSGGVRAGGGMRGMADRVHALGGELAVHSTTDGTRVRAVIPCAS
jgi:signal transduction histidine kinase